MRLSDLAVLWFGAYLVIARKLSLGQLIAFRIISGYVASPLLRLVQSWQQFQEVGLSIERLGDILDSPPEQHETAAQNIPMPPIEGTVSFDRVCFSYVSGASPQLRDVQFEVPAGAFVGVVGQSGSGKSTLLKLLPRLYSPDSGRIFIDRYDIGKVELYSLRRQIGMVLQDSLLFDGTIQENIGLADPDAPSEAIVAAARVAFAHDFIMGLADGYNTRVGEGGRALSGGQRQRIAIARVVLQQPRLLVLDEATSAVDFMAERQICRNLAEAFKGRTVFFVTHRLRSIQAADLILFLEDGVIAERGTHEELMALRGRYSSLYQQQDLPT
jgi:ATP-binding cassette subfamily B protein